jgi:hypothetical protein
MARASSLFSRSVDKEEAPMQRIRMMVGSAMLVALFACSGGASDPAESSTSSSPPASPTSAATAALEGTWRSVLDANALEQRAFSTQQIHLLQVQDEWSSQQVNEIRIDGASWVLSQGVDGEAPTPHGDFGQISVTPERIRLDLGNCIQFFQYQLVENQLDLTLERSTCDEVPGDSVPDFMYAAVYGQPFERQG